MAAITTGVIAAGTAAYGAHQQRGAARDAARAQAQGVEAAQQNTIDATNRARQAFIGGVDPRQEYLQGVQSGLQFTNQGYGQSMDTVSPLAALAQPYIDEQYNLLGMGGPQAYQQALGRVSDPLVAEQERALMRNSAALGGVGGNELAALADMTRNRTEANIGNRLSQLGVASSPALGALQQIANLRLNQGLNMSDIMRQSGSDLANMETNRRQALANIELGQGSQMAQLSQNLGTARAGGSAFAAQQTNPLVQGLQAGIGGFMGAGGSFGNLFGGGQQVSSPLGNIANMTPIGSTFNPAATGGTPGQINLRY